VLSRIKTAFLVLLSFGVLASGSFFLFFPKIGSWLVRTKVLPRIAERLDRLEEAVVACGMAGAERIVGFLGEACRAPLPFANGLLVFQESLCESSPSYDTRPTKMAEIYFNWGMRLTYHA